MRSFGLILATTFVGLFDVLTVVEVAQHGISGLAVVSLFILVLLTIGVLSAFRRPR